MAFYYNQVNELGDIIAEKIRLLPTTPSLPEGHRWVPYIPSLETRRQEIIQLIKEKRDNKLSTGGFKVDNKWFHSDTFSRSQQLGLVLLGNSLPSNIDWKTMDKSFVRLTPQLVQQIFTSAVQQDNSLFTHAENLISMVLNSSTPETIDIDSGWPATFNG